MKKPTMTDQDIHLVMNAQTRKLKCFTRQQGLKWMVHARAEGVAGPGWDRTYGDTPPGLYSCTRIQPTLASEPRSVFETYGPYFVFLQDEEARRRGGHTGIGIHGGRDRSPGRPPSSAAELSITHGCIRVDNHDLEHQVIPAIRWAQRNGGTAWLTVEQ